MADEKKIVSASPKVRKLAREFGADIYQIQGSQRKGRVSEEDIKSFVKEHIVTYALSALAKEQLIASKDAVRAMKKYKINKNKPIPTVL